MPPSATTAHRAIDGDGGEYPALGPHEEHQAERGGGHG